MKLYHFHNPYQPNFAQATRHGTWYPPGVKVCPECGASRQKRVSPLIIEWDVGSDIVGDFVWPGFDDELVITQKVKDLFESRFCGVEYGPVEFWQDPKIKRPVKVTRRSRPRVWLPYSGPTLWDVIPTLWCHLDHVQSNVTKVKVCSTCGTVFYKIPTRPNRHLIVDLTSWRGEGIFHVYENPGLYFCTEQVKDVVEQAECTNFSFLEDGIIPE
jgi:hypothetical protein